MGSFLSGVLMFLSLGLVPEWLFMIFALVVNLWMVGIGLLLWRQANSYDNI